MNKQHILDEIRRTAKDNFGIPLGKERFQRETGIKESDWAGKFWVRWGDAPQDAGFSPNQMQSAFSDDLLLEKFVELARELRRFPVNLELRLKRRNDPAFPSHNTFDRFGNKKELASRIIAFCEKVGGYDDVIKMCSDRLLLKEQSPNNEDEESGSDKMGFVYLLKSGRNYKIGMTYDIGRREYDLKIQLPDKPQRVHIIKTDDPVGIEAYWHKRFDAKRKGGEWFELSNADVKAFMRRKFM